MKKKELSIMKYTAVVFESSKVHAVPVKNARQFAVTCENCKKRNTFDQYR